MPIRIEYGPVGLAMRLAQQAGRGEAKSRKWERDFQLLQYAQRQQQMEADVTSRSRAFALQSAMAKRMAGTLTQRAGRLAKPVADQVLERMRYKSTLEAQQRGAMQETIAALVKDGTLSLEQGKIATFGAATGNEAIISAALKPSLPAAPGTVPQREQIPYAAQQEMRMIQGVSEEDRKYLYSRRRFLQEELEKPRIEGETDDVFKARLDTYRRELDTIPQTIQKSLQDERIEVQRILRQAQTTTGAIKTRPLQPSGGAPEPPEETPTGLPQVPADRKKRIAGQHYLTADGQEVRWTGTKFQVRS